MSIKSPIGRVAYPNIAVARKRNENAKPRYSVTLVYPEGTDLSDLKAIARKAAEKKFQNGIPDDLRSPFRPGESRRNKETGNLPEGFLATDIFVEFWRYEEHGAVPCVDSNPNNPLLASDVYAGMTGRVFCNASGYNVDGNRGVSLHLEAFQKAADGEPIGNAPVDPKTAFDTIGAGAGTEAVGDVRSVEDIF